MFLAQEQISALAPAVYGQKSERLSTKYQFQNSGDLVRVMEENGWGVVGVAQPVTRSPKRSPLSCTHRVMFQPEQYKREHGLAPRVILLNSHDGRSKIKLQAGFYRFACANGLIIGEDSYAMALTHRQNHQETLEAWLEQIAQTMPKLHEKIEDWRKLDSSAVAPTYAKAATQLRFGEGWKAYEPKDLLEVTRDEDEGMGLWQVYNRIQEGIIEKPISKIEGRGRAKPVREVQKEVSMNKWLWNLAQITEAAINDPAVRKAFEKEVQQEKFIKSYTVEEMKKELELA